MTRGNQKIPKSIIGCGGLIRHESLCIIRKSSVHNPYLGAGREDAQGEGQPCDSTSEVVHEVCGGRGDGCGESEEHLSSEQSGDQNPDVCGCKNYCCDMEEIIHTHLSMQEVQEDTTTYNTLP